jgi:pimeloyl-ACP methyl ester carboxylesterase
MQSSLKRWTLTVLRVLVVAYAGICVLLYLRQDALLYPAHLTRMPVEQVNFKLDRGGIVLRGWHFNPGQGRALLYFGGNAERVEDAARMLAGELPGATIHALAYRGYGASDGVPDEQALVSDAFALFDEVRAEQPDRPIAVIGRSLGSGVASQLAAKRPVERLALVTPFDSLATMAQSMYPFLPVRWLLRDHYDSVSHLAGYRGPLLVVRAGRDRVIPPASTDRLLASLPDDVLVVNLASSDHNDIDADPRYLAALADFLEPDPAPSARRQKSTQ